MVRGTLMLVHGRPRSYTNVRIRGSAHGGWRSHEFPGRRGLPGLTGAQGHAEREHRDVVLDPRTEAVE